LSFEVKNGLSFGLKGFVVRQLMEQEDRPTGPYIEALVNPS
jgi:hypothetical protein